MTTDLAQPDTRPDWLADPSLTEVDHALIDAMKGKEVPAMYGRGEQESSQPTLDPTVVTAEQVAQEEAQAPAAAPDPALVVPPVDTTEPTAADTAAEEEATEPVVIPTTIPIQLADGTVTEITQAQALQLLQQNAWLQNRPREVLDAWGQVERGARTISPAELAEYQALKAAKSAPQAPIVPDLSTLTPEQQAYVQSLQAARTAQNQPQTPVYDPNEAPVISQAALEARARELAREQVIMEADLTAVRDEYTAKYSLTPQQLDLLEKATIQSNRVAEITEKGKLYSPTGDLISKPRFADTLRSAFDEVMTQHPVLKDVRDELVFNQRLASQQATASNTDKKKARAGSLAAAPSAAVSSGQVSPSKMTQQQTAAAISQEIAMAISNGTAGN